MLLLLAGIAVLSRAVLAETPAPATATVTIGNFSFGAAPVTVKAGTKVTWTNQDDIPHTVTSDATPRDFKSPPLDSGEAFSFVFDRPGTYTYFCSIHPKMQGSIIVKPAG